MTTSVDVNMIVKPMIEALHESLSQLRTTWAAFINSPLAWTDVQQRSITTLSLHIARLEALIRELSPCAGRLSSSTRHDLRTELTVILGYTQLLLHKRVGLSDQQAAALLTALLKIGDHINDLLEQDRSQSSPPSA